MSRAGHDYFLQVTSGSWSFSAGLELPFRAAICLMTSPPKLVLCLHQETLV